MKIETKISKQADGEPSPNFSAAVFTFESNLTSVAQSLQNSGGLFAPWIQTNVFRSITTTLHLVQLRYSLQASDQQAF